MRWPQVNMALDLQSALREEKEGAMLTAWYEANKKGHGIK